MKVGKSHSLHMMQADVGDNDAWLGSLGIRLQGSREEGPGKHQASPGKYSDKALRLEVEDKVSLATPVLLFTL